MNKKIIALTVFAVTMLCGCTPLTEQEISETSGHVSEEVTYAEETSSVTEDISETTVSLTTASETEPEEPVGHLMFKSGVWSSLDENSSLYYYCFREDMTGSRIAQSDGAANSFGCRNTDDEAGLIFFINEIDSMITANVNIIDENCIELLWEGDKKETLLFLDDVDEDYFSVLTNDTLCEMALGYFESVSGYRPSYAEASVNEDRTVSVHLYDIVDDQTDTSERYEINPLDGMGTGMHSDEIIDFSTAPLG